MPDLVIPDDSKQTGATGFTPSTWNFKGTDFEDITMQFYNNLTGDWYGIWSAYQADQRYARAGDTSTSIYNEKPTGTKNGTNMVFTLVNSPLVNEATIFLNGLAQDPGVDYSISTATITFLLSAPISTDVITVNYNY